MNRNLQLVLAVLMIISGALLMDLSVFLTSGCVLIVTGGAVAFKILFLD